jgi:hypothetical protein
MPHRCAVRGSRDGACVPAVALQATDLMRKALPNVSSCPVCSAAYTPCCNVQDSVYSCEVLGELQHAASAHSVPTVPSRTC